MKNKKSLIVSVSTVGDLDKITKDTKYINIDITNPNHDIITYFVENGINFKYTDSINDVAGYNYVDYETFKKAEEIIDMIYANMPNDLSKLEIARYLYIAIGKLTSFDINTDPQKNEMYNLNLMSVVNNLWGSLAISSVTDITASKIYYYLLRRLDIKCDIVIDNEKKTALTKLFIAKEILLTDLFSDIPYIKGMLMTRHFATYNDDFNMDKRVKYIKNKYNDYYVDKALKDIDYTNEDCVWFILNKTEKLFNLNMIKSSELALIYKYIFEKYCPNYNIKINNLFFDNKLKKHFILISYNDMHYSYNYKKREFVSVMDNDILDNINIGKIGLYMDEYIPNISNY